MIGEIDKKVISSLALKFFERISVKLLGFVVGIVLARLLVPEDFGQIAIIMVFVNLCQTFITSGFSTSLVQKKEVDSKDYSTAFTITIALSVLMTAVLFFVAPQVAAFYEAESIIFPLRVYAFSLLFASLNSVQNAKLQKEMKFKIVLYTSLVSTVLSGALGIAVALMGGGIWALVAYYFSHTILSSIAIAIADRWLPSITFYLESAKQLFSYGWKMLVSALLCSMYADVRTLIIGKMFSQEQLGYYNRGHQMPEIVSQSLDTSIQGVMFTVLSSVQDDKEKLIQFLRKTLKLCGFVTIPAMLGLAVVSKPLIAVLLTEKWLPAVEFMQILCLGNITLSLISANLIAIKSTGRSDIYMRLEIIRRVAMLVVLLVTVFVFKSIIAIAWGFVVSSVIDYFIVAIASKKMFNYGLLMQFKDLWKILLSSLVMGALTWLIGFLPLAHLLVLVIQIVIGVSSYSLLCLVFRVDIVLKISRRLVKRKESL